MRVWKEGWEWMCSECDNLVQSLGLNDGTYPISVDCDHCDAIDTVCIDCELCVQCGETNWEEHGTD